MARRCHRCRAAVPDEQRVGRRDTCAGCGSYLHCCLNCTHYERGRHNDCREPQAELQADREHGNFCEHFAFADRAETPASPAAGARARLEALFAKKTAVLLLFALLAACRPALDTPEGVAERFLDEHYVNMDLTAALDYTVGPAQQKVEHERKLIGDQMIDAGTRKPRVTYERLERRDEGSERATFVYEGSIRVEGASAFTRRWLINVRREAGAWKVSNFQEFEPEEKEAADERR